ncbi:HesB/IscA family protein [Hydrogenovibrio kuenenii]|uniref:HesB/IscA family protein n=1 Tax=Hydrogenovibrio kuenenii TaxID=63658 RepID=UPI0004655C95|nr:iron-sulfur cluster assembly accessory protein [Hydrogenovibrio kuenenii]
MSVTLTEAAAERVRTMLAKRGHGLGIKLATKVSGCAGFAYVVDYADEITDSDAVFESHGQKVVVPQKSLELVDGTELDYVKESLLNEGFEFHNPRVKDSCGCGESFSV